MAFETVHASDLFCWHGMARHGQWRDTSHARLLVCMAELLFIKHARNTQEAVLRIQHAGGWQCFGALCSRAPTVAKEVAPSASAKVLAPCMQQLPPTVPRQTDSPATNEQGANGAHSKVSTKSKQTQ